MSWKKTGETNGLKLSLEKTKIMKIRGPDVGDKIGKYEVVKDVKYLGVQIGGRGRNIFEAENKKWIEKAEKKANALIGQIKKSADKNNSRQSYLETNGNTSNPIWESCGDHQ